MDINSLIVTICSVVIAIVAAFGFGMFRGHRTAKKEQKNFDAAIAISIGEQHDKFKTQFFDADDIDDDHDSLLAKSRAISEAGKSYDLLHKKRDEGPA